MRTRNSTGRKLKTKDLEKGGEPGVCLHSNDYHNLSFCENLPRQSDFTKYEDRDCREDLVENTSTGSKAGKLSKCSLL